MSYGISAVRLDMGRQAQIRTSQFYGIPGSLTHTEIVKSMLCFLLSYN